MTEKNVHPEDYVAFSNFKLLLISVFRIIFKFFDLIGITCRRHPILLLIGAVIGGLLGWFYHSTAGKNYKVSMVVEYTSFDKRPYMNVLNQLNGLAVTSSGERLASELNISTALANNINSIEPMGLEGDPLRKDTASNGLFNITVGLKTPFEADSLQQALVDYFNNLPYFRKLKADKAKIYEHEIGYLNAELDRLDSLKREYVHSLASVKMTSGFYNNAIDAGIYKESYRMDSMRGVFRNWLDHGSKAMWMISGFKPTNSPQNLSRSLSIISCVLLGMFVAFIIGFFTEIKKRIDVA